MELEYWNKCGPNDGVAAHTVKGVPCRGPCAAGIDGFTEVTLLILCYCRT